VRTFLAPVLRTGARPSGQPEDKGIIPFLGLQVNLGGNAGNPGSERIGENRREQERREKVTWEQVIRKYGRKGSSRLITA
jgi:hypothetical protein